MRFLLLAALAPLLTDAQPSAPKFEVASIKPAPTRPSHVGIKLDGARVDIGYWSLKQLLLRAYALQPAQVSGPDWLDTARFDILARIPAGATPDQLPQMLQSLLADRFRLVAHRETRPLPAYALIVAKGGPRMKRAASDSGEPQPVDTGRILDSLWSGEAAERPFGLTASHVDGADLHLEFAKLPLSALAQIVASYLRTPVIDDTRLAGTYQATLDFSIGSSPEGDASIVSTVQRLGLKLERRTAALTVLVVDRVERTPTEN